MKCPKCNIEARIVNSKYVVEDDDTSLIPTKLFLAQTFVCRNRQCEDFEKEIAVVKNPIQLSKE